MDGVVSMVKDTASPALPHDGCSPWEDSTLDFMRQSAGVQAAEAVTALLLTKSGSNSDRLIRYTDYGALEAQGRNTGKETSECCWPWAP